MITLATLPAASAQEVFDQVVNHLLTQRERSENADGCLYRSGSLRCAAGCLISDSEYRAEMEGNNWADLKPAGMVPAAHYQLISELQAAHDNYSHSEWESCLKKVAECNGLAFNWTSS